MNGIYLNSQEQLNHFCNRASNDKQFGLDLEFIPENTFYPELALIQLSVGDSLMLVDPLRGHDLTPLFDLVASPDVEVVVHAGIQDMGILVNLSGRIPARVFDLQVAASLLGMGHQVSYGQLVQRLFDVTLPKSESFSEWLRRPLSEKQEQYALDDVRFLLPAVRKIKAQLLEAGRDGWALEEMLSFEKKEHWQNDPDSGWHRVKRSRELRGRELEVLKAVARWRENEAMKRNLPRRKVIDDDAMIEIARSHPASIAELARIRGISREGVKISGSSIIGAVEEGMRAPWPPTERPVVQRLSADGETVAEYLLFCFKALCASLNIAPGAVSSRAEVESLTQDYMDGTLRFERHRLLVGWRLEAIGAKLIECLEGRLRVKMNPTTRKIEFSQ